jgi:RND family efflux transporter MFP subunit
MKLMKSLAYLVVAAAIAASALFVGYTLGRQSAPANAPKAAAGDAKDEKERQDVVAKVKVAPAHSGVIEQTVTAYGTVVASPEDVRIIAVPFECRVRHVLTVAGQAVAAETKLIEVEPSPEALLALSDARTTKLAAERDLAQVGQRLEMKLATKTEVSTAEQALQLAQSKFDSLEKRGIEAKQLVAGLAGLVSKVDVQEGQLVPAGGTLVEVVSADRIQVKLGVEPDQARQLKPGQAVHVQIIRDGQGAPVDGELKLITQRINPASRLVDAYVALPANSPLMLETFVRARIIVSRKEALVVPRSAVLPEEGKHVLFTVAGAKAVEHEVEVGLADADNVELLSGDVKPGDSVVVQGNAELEKDMAVEVEEEPAPATQAATQPTSAEGDRS